MTIILTERQRHLARHALGLPNRSRRSYRNHFVAGPGHGDYDDWMAMVSAGAARRRDGSTSPLTGGDDLFWLTADGARAGLARGEKLDPEDFPEA
ncbi:hypothetical protein Ga0061061_11193 [Chelatococcus sambhunathii]|uniref:Uncharacterized protein n=1 Tax=Chelatococcus sambhunathii TaxID=363953 RepID=A0ABM9U8H8_9HYPH|nr:hypothetical protein [Chelatococcus sambhunathii]CUA90167.1 hypothetical protein Ga0061061_11193 [Chelatococcus sambhunathii]